MTNYYPSTGVRHPIQSRSSNSRDSSGDFSPPPVGFSLFSVDSSCFSSDALLSTASAGHGWALTTGCLLQRSQFIGKERSQASRVQQDNYDGLPGGRPPQRRSVFNDVLLRRDSVAR
jgi:hypothetical protein